MKQLDSLLYNVDVAKMAIEHDREHFSKWFLARLILGGYRDFSAPIFLQLSGSFLSYAYTFVDSQLPVCARFVVYSYRSVVRSVMVRM